MPNIGIKDVSVLYDGEYELDLDIAFSTNEWRWIKQVAGYAPMSIQTGLEDGDPSLFCALAVIAMHRAGKINREQVLQAAEVLADAPFDGSTITILAGDEDEEGEESPLALTSEPDASSLSGSLAKPSGSGPDLRTGSDQLDVTPEGIGATR